MWCPHRYRGLGTHHSEWAAEGLLPSRKGHAGDGLGKVATAPASCCCDRTTSTAWSRVHVTGFPAHDGGFTVHPAVSCPRACSSLSSSGPSHSLQPVQQTCPCAHAKFPECDAPSASPSLCVMPKSRSNFMIDIPLIPTEGTYVARTHTYAPSSEPRMTVSVRDRHSLQR